MTKSALLFGLLYHDTANELKGCQNDIKNVQQYLKTIGYEKFTILMDDKDDKLYESPTCPTRNNILKALREAIEAQQENDELFIQYSGHGSYTKDKNGDEVDRRDESICPVDGEHIIDDELFEIISKINPKAKCFVLFDSCHSGSAIDLPFRYFCGNRSVRENNHTGNANIIFISGCKDKQTSSDTVEDDQNTGAMTWALLKILNRYKGVSQKNRTITWRDLIVDMRILLKTYQYKQVPQLNMMVAEHLNNKLYLL